MMYFDSDIQVIPLIPLGSRSQIEITANSREENVTFTWELKGPGKLREGKKSFVRVYEIPDTIDERSKEATITVTMIKDEEKIASDSVTFTLIDPIIEPEKVVTIPISLPNRNLGIKCMAIFGEVEYSQQGEIIYTAPKKPGSFDIVTVRAVDKGTGKIVQEIINITIRDKLQQNLK
jgi:hypothetical protein